MTAYASSDFPQPGGRAKWEIRSVNHRYLELSFKLPERLRSLEFSLRELAKQVLHRGKVECWLQWEPETTADQGLALNTDVIKHLSEACHTIQQLFQKQLPLQTFLSPMEVLKWPEVCNRKETEISSEDQSFVTAFKAALEQLVLVRSQEGEALAKIIRDRLDYMEKIVQRIKPRLPEVLKNQREKLTSRLNEIKSDLNSDRLEQEMLYFAQKIDISEEIDRLSTHIQSGRAILKKGGVVGRQLDFLMQELNREANTLASKSTDIEIIQMGMELKLTIEQIREQVQNLE